MRVNGALQGRWPSIGDECADMTVIHGDVYSKLSEGERLHLRGINREKGRKRKRGSERRMFFLNPVLSTRKLAKFT